MEVSAKNWIIKVFKFSLLKIFIFFGLLKISEILSIKDDKRIVNYYRKK